MNGLMKPQLMPEKKRIHAMLLSQAQRIRKSYAHLERKAADVLSSIDSYLANSKRTPIRLIPEEWGSAY